MGREEAWRGSFDSSCARGLDASCAAGRRGPTRPPSPSLSFVKSFDDRPPDPDRDATLVQDFLTAQESVLRAHPVWAGGGAATRALAAEGLEKYVCTKIHARTFAVAALDRERDEALAARMRGLSFVQPEHLDIPPARADASALAAAAAELARMDTFKAPRDKLVCVLNACRIVGDALAAGGGVGGGAASPSSPQASGADDFLPLLILALIRASPPRLASNLEYVQRFRGGARFTGEASYFFTQLYSAASFVETVNTGSLTVDPATFVEAMRGAGVPELQLAPAPGGGGASPRAAAGAPSAAPPCPDAATLEAEGAALVAAADALGALAGAHPFLYRDAPSLTLADVAALLDAYKEAVLRAEALGRAADARAAGASGGGSAAAARAPAPAASLI